MKYMFVYIIKLISGGQIFSIVNSQFTLNTNRRNIRRRRIQFHRDYFRKNIFPLFAGVSHIPNKI